MSNPIVSFDEQAVKDELRELVRKTIEETINAMLDEKADRLVGAGPYERTDERAAYRAGHYERVDALPQARADEAEGGRKGRARGLRRDPRVLYDAPRALAAHPHEQRDQAAQQGDKAQDPRGRHLSRRRVRTHAGGHSPEVRRRQRLGVASLSGRVATHGVAVPAAG